MARPACGSPSERTLAQPNAASFARRLVLPCRAGTTPGRTDTRSGRLASLLTSRSTSGLPVRLTGYWSSLRLVTGALRSRLLRRRAGVWSGSTLRRRWLEQARVRALEEGVELDLRAADIREREIEGPAALI